LAFALHPAHPTVAGALETADVHTPGPPAATATAAASS
jgi:hypothetical protein